MEFLNYEFMRKAIVVGCFLAVVLPLVGSSVVLRKMSMLGDTLSHSSLAGVTCGLVFGFNPIASAIVMCIVASIGIEVVRRKFPHNEEIAIAILMSFSVGVTGIASSFVQSSANFNSYLFGSIVAITNEEFFLVIIVSLIVGFLYTYFYKEIMYMSFDETGARLAGVKTRRMNFMLTLSIAVIVAIAAKTVGALVVSSIMVIPIATTILSTKSYKSMLVQSIIISLFSVFVGLLISFYTGLKPGGTIVLLSLTVLIVNLIRKK